MYDLILQQSVKVYSSNEVRNVHVDTEIIEKKVKYI